MTPQITLDSEDGIYTVKVGRELTIAPTVQYAENALFSWTLDGKLLSTEPTLTHTWSEAAEVYVMFTVQNENGKAEEELKVVVLEMAPPVISLALPSKGLKVLQNTDYIFTPDIQNSDLEEFRCEWLREGEVVSESVTYTFNEAELGTYTVVCHASNIDGETTKEITLEVVDELPYEVFFHTQSIFRTSTDRYVYIGTPIFLEPQLSYFDNPQFVWSVDGETVPDAVARMFRYTPTEAGEHIVRVTVSEAKQQAKQLTRNIIRAETAFTAEVKVTCVDAAQEDRYRPATGDSSPLWNKVWEYTPAPGQFVGEMKTGGFDGTETTQEAAVAYAEGRLKEKIWVSLGAFGGYIVVGFDHSIPKRATAEGEYDFTIQGNAFDGSSEPGIVWVMQDINKNGEPDDEWYELRGSDTDKEGTIQNYAVTYYRPAGKQMDVQWTDSEGKSGCIDYLITYHQQDYYYPAWIKSDTYTLYGTRLAPNNVQDPATGYWDNQSYGWGYVDNFSETDNLGGDVVDGSGQTNGFRIANAMYRDGTPVDLQYVDFIKVQTGVQVKSGWLGEVSTEVFSFSDLSVATDNENNK
ncbi:PKD-like domain-containing protein [uncultured Alistipes sp.]|uniref:PKD-like domain-containing protein n=1 Tax=uncultured Alistipes sp. TaxID=538949 RepID=UPI003390478C